MPLVINSSNSEQLVVSDTSKPPVTLTPKEGTTMEISKSLYRQSQGVSLTVPVKVQGIEIQAIIDTGAEVNVISQEVYDRLVPQVKRIKEEKFFGAGNDMRMVGFRTEPIELKLGTSVFHDEVYVAPIQDPMLIGLLFLIKHNFILNADCLCLGGEKIEINSQELTSKEAKVKLDKSV